MNTYFLCIVSNYLSMESKRFKELLSKYEKGTATTQELEVLESFFENMQKDGVNLDEVKRDLGLKNRIYTNINREIKSSSKHRIKKTLVVVSAVAACIILYLSINSIFNLSGTEKQDWITLENSEEVPQQYYLPDSSSIWLSQNSKLEYALDFGQQKRSTQLYGQAFFDITKNQNKPFIIKTGELVTEVLGTSFNIKQNDGLVEVSVSSGLVNVSVDQQNLKLSPNEKVSYESASQSLIKTKTNAQLQQLWFKGEVLLEKVKLTELAQVLSEIYKKDFVFKDDEAKKVKLYSLRLKQDEPLQNLIERINFINEVQFKNKKNIIEIRKK